MGGADVLVNAGVSFSHLEKKLGDAGLDSAVASITATTAQVTAGVRDLTTSHGSLGAQSLVDWSAVPLKFKEAVLNVLAPAIRELALDKQRLASERKTLEESSLKAAKTLQSLGDKVKWYHPLLQFVSPGAKRLLVSYQAEGEALRTAHRQIEERTHAIIRIEREISQLFRDFRIANDPYSRHIAEERTRLNAIREIALECSEAAGRALKCVDTFTSPEEQRVAVQSLQELTDKVWKRFLIKGAEIASVPLAPQSAKPTYLVSHLPPMLGRAFEQLFPDLGRLGHVLQSEWNTGAEISPTTKEPTSALSNLFSDFISELNTLSQSLKEHDATRIRITKSLAFAAR